MSSTQRKIGVVTGLIIISLAGLLTVQGMLLKNAWDQKDQAFRRNVMMVLSSVAQKLETRETAASALATIPRGAQYYDTCDTAGLLARIPIPPQARFHKMTVATATAFDSRSVGGADVDSVGPLRVIDGTVHYSVPRRERVRIQVYDSTRHENLILVDAVKDPGQYQYQLPDPSLKGCPILFNVRTDQSMSGGNDSVFFKFSSDSNSMMFQVSSGKQTTSTVRGYSAGNKQQMVSRMIDQLFFVEMEPIERRLNDTVLDSVIASTMKESGLDLKYAFGVIDLRDSLNLVHPADLMPQIRSSEFRTRLFPHDMFAPANELALFFPERTTYLWTQIGPLLGLTSLFMIVIASCFAYSIRTIVRQRQFAHRTADFINNMTHEFKTPISTISLATEALVKPEFAAQGESVQRFGRMIQEENKRMSGQVEKILQMATLEEGDYELNLSVVDMHELIRKAVNAVTLRVQGRSGTLISDLLAERASISGDPLHLSNIIYNLLDNALKYTTDTPTIRVATENRGDELLVTIEDNGIGIAEKDRRLVFEKYYRVPTGNVHNVKGFGIGLSYVKLMVLAHHGRIVLESEPGKGTRIELAFPSATAGRE
jgi:signal transduction histidine kinase